MARRAGQLVATYVAADTQRAAEGARFVDPVKVLASAKSPFRGWRVAGPAAALACCALFVGVTQRRSDPTAPVAQDRSLSPVKKPILPEVLVGPGHWELDAGARISLGAGARLEVRASDPSVHGAYQLRLLGGEAHIGVAKPAETLSVSVGAYAVQVAGAVFSLEAGAHGGLIRARVDSGELLLVGPGAAGTQRLTPGQAWAVEPEAQAAVGPRARNITDKLTAVALPRLSAPSDPCARANAGAARNWRLCAAAGSPSGVLERAHAAQLAGQNDRAHALWQALSRRFPGTPAAADAAFFEARLYESDGAAARALEFYKRYLIASPSGLYAGSALAGVMLLEWKRGEAENAQHTAATYLRRFPDGPYAQHAHDILRALR